MKAQKHDQDFVWFPALGRQLYDVLGYSDEGQYALHMCVGAYLQLSNHTKLYFEILYFRHLFFLPLPPNFW